MRPMLTQRSRQRFELLDGIQLVIAPTGGNSIQPAVVFAPIHHGVKAVVGVEQSLGRADVDLDRFDFLDP